MATGTGTHEHVFKLSTIANVAPKTYNRYGLCFPYNDTIDEMNVVFAALQTAVKRAISYTPILAGHVRPSTAGIIPQPGLSEVAVSFEDVCSFYPVFKRFQYDEFPYTYANLQRLGMPPGVFINSDFTPLPDTPDTKAPIFAVQCNFIPGGVVVAIYLHNSAADMASLQTIISHMSSDNLPIRQLTDDDVRRATVEQSRIRDRLSGSRGARPEITAQNPFTPDMELVEEITPTQQSVTPNLPTKSHILAFNLPLIQNVTDIVKDHLSQIHNIQHIHIDSCDVLLAILWKAIIRARRNTGTIEHLTASSLLLPLDIRNKIEPALDSSYIGNAELYALANSDVLRLMMPYEVNNIARHAAAITTGATQLDERSIRQSIADINMCLDFFSSTKAKGKEIADVVVSDWVDVRLERAHLGLGLGTPGWARKLGRAVEVGACTMHSPREEELEVTVELLEKTMEALRADTAFNAYLRCIV